MTGNATTGSGDGKCLRRQWKNRGASGETKSLQACGNLGVGSPERQIGSPALGRRRRSVSTAHGRGRRPRLQVREDEADVMARYRARRWPDTPVRRPTATVHGSDDTARARTRPATAGQVLDMDGFQPLESISPKIDSPLLVLPLLEIFLF
uniref:Uncharacterized protein n=1 Tax=Leersia perrieri TaxID=77586 RepID=A0A0D9XRF9_9ORYZ